VSTASAAVAAAPAPVPGAPPKGKAARQGSTGQETAFGRLMNAAAETEGRKAGPRGGKDEADGIVSVQAAAAPRAGKQDPKAGLATDAKVEDAKTEDPAAETGKEETKEADAIALLMAALVPADAPVETAGKAATTDGQVPEEEPEALEDADAPASGRAARGQLATLLAGPTLPARIDQSGPEDRGEQTAGDFDPTVETTRGVSARTQPADDARAEASPGLTLQAKRESSQQPDAKMTVVSVQTAPAPASAAPAPISATGTALVASIEADGTLTSYVTETASLPAGDARPMTTLKLQLHPAELGNVTVKISGTGDEISIEVQVENTEARQRLASDSDAIVKSLRVLGYDIERVSVQQIAPAAGVGQQETATGSGRDDGFAAFDQRGGERGQNQQGNADTGGRNDGQERVASHPQADRGNTAGTVYI
jgi:chemotaxis protein MotD